MSLTDQTTDAQKSAIFDGVIAAVRADTLVSGSTVIVNSLMLGTCEYWGLKSVSTILYVHKT